VSDEPARQTLSALRATRAAHRIAADVSASRIQALSTRECQRCGRRFSVDPDGGGDAALCPACHEPGALPLSPAATRLSSFIDVVCTELGLPPPDLVVDDPFAPSTAPAASEMWQFDGRHLRIFARAGDGSVQPALCSRAFPFLPIPDLEDLLIRTRKEDYATAVLAFAQWVRALKR
jgi:hypothetical protein